MVRILPPSLPDAVALVLRREFRPAARRQAGVRVLAATLGDRVLGPHRSAQGRAAGARRFLRAAAGAGLAQIADDLDHIRRSGPKGQTARAAVVAARRGEIAE